MTSASEIIDEKTFEAWLENRPRKDAVVLAHRSAMRVLPLWGAEMTAEWARKEGLTTLPLLRCGLISAVAALEPLAAYAVTAYGDALAAANFATRAFAAAAATRAATAAVVGNAAAATVAAAAAASRATVAAATVAAAIAATRDAVWEAVRQDAEKLETDAAISSTPLWQNGSPDWFEEAYKCMIDVWDTDPKPRWAFWRRWWHGVVTGQPLDAHLQLAIVRGIDDETWKDPDAAAARILEIEAAFRLDVAISLNPHAWRVVFDPKTGSFTATDIEPRDMSRIVEDARDAINAFHRRCRKLSIANFGQSLQMAFKPVIDELRRDLKRFGDQPYSLYKAITLARQEMETIALAEQFATESYLTRFFQTLDDLAEDVCIASPTVVEQLKAKAALRWELASLDRRRDMMRITLSLHLDSEGILKRAALEALRILADESSSDEMKRDALYFCRAVLPRAARAYINEKDEAALSPAARESSRLKRTAEYLDLIAKSDKAIDAFQENLPEAHEGVQRLIELLGQGSNPFG